MASLDTTSYSHLKIHAKVARQMPLGNWGGICRRGVVHLNEQQLFPRRLRYGVVRCAQPLYSCFLRQQVAVPDTCKQQRTKLQDALVVPNTYTATKFREMMHA